MNFSGLPRSTNSDNNSQLARMARRLSGIFVQFAAGCARMRHTVTCNQSDVGGR